MIPLEPDTNEEDDDTHEDEVIHENDMDEWEMLSRLVPPNTVQVSDIDTLGRRDFDLIHAWNSTTGWNRDLEDPTDFIKNVRSRGSIPNVSHSMSASPSSFSDKQRLCFETIIQHFHEGPNADPLKMIIQGTAGTGKYYLIHCIGHEFSMHSIDGKIPLLLLAPTGVATPNI